MVDVILFMVWCCCITYTDNTVPVMKFTEQDVNRFISKYDIGEDCWLWKCGVAQDGYGAFWLRSAGTKGTNVRAHRFSWEMYNAREIPDGMVVMHTCDNPLCVRAEHLKLGTPADNSADMARKGRAATGKRNGKHTHPEKIERGDYHWTRRMPNKVRRGDNYWTAKRRGCHRKGSNHPNSKLNESVVRDIRDKRNKGESVKSIANRFGVSRDTIYNIIKGKVWSHVK